MTIFRRLWNVIRPRRADDDIDQEMATHRALIEEEERGRGLSQADAAAMAHHRLGNTTTHRESMRDMDLLGWLEAAKREVFYAARVLRKSPAYTVFAVLAIALGIGSTTLMFSIVNSLILRQPPFPDANRLVMVWQRLLREDRVSFSSKEFLAWDGRSAVFERLAVFTGNGFTMTGQGDVELVRGMMVTPSFFEVLGVNPAIGRPFLASEGEPGHDHEVVLSNQLWREKFSARGDIVGQTVMLNDTAYAVVGVMPPGFDFPQRDYKLWVPAALRGSVFQKFPDAHLLRVVGRVKPGISEARIRAELDTLRNRLKSDDRSDRHYYAVALREALNGDLREPLVVLLLAVGLLLLIACANVANLTLARGTARHREIAVRGALGAGRGRLIRQLLTESTLVALAGGAFGAALSVAALRFLTAYASKTVPQLMHVRIDVWALGFAFVASAMTGLFSGLTPALTATRDHFHTDLREGTRSTAGRGTNRSRSALVFVEIALAAVLLAGSGLMIRSFVTLMNVDPGFRPDGLIAAGVPLHEKTYPEAPDILKFYRKAMAGLRTLPGVVSVGMITHLPFSGNNWGNSYDVEGHPAPPGKDYVAQIRPSSPGYFGAMGIPLKQGRDFAETDSEKTMPVAIVNELLAKRFWPNESPLGKRIRFNTEWMTIVGVCGDIKHLKLDEASDPEIYLPYPQLPAGIMKFVGRDNYYVIRSSVNAGQEARAVLRSLDPEIVVDVSTMDHLIGDSVAAPRFRTWLIACFSILALILACLGIYGVISYIVNQRLGEIGLRIALGARRADIVREVMFRSAKLAVAGVAAGLLVASFVTRFLGSLLFEIAPHDAIAYAGAGVLLVSVALLAGYVPASRAARTDPTIALRG